MGAHAHRPCHEGSSSSVQVPAWLYVRCFRSLTRTLAPTESRGATLETRECEDSHTVAWWPIGPAARFRGVASRLCVARVLHVCHVRRLRNEGVLLLV